MVKYPNPKDLVRVTWRISVQTMTILEYYQRFCRLEKEDIADEFLKNLLGNPRFAEYLKTQRRTKRMIRRIFNGDGEMRLLNEYASSPQYAASIITTNEKLDEDYDDEDDGDDTGDDSEDIDDEHLKKMSETIRRTNAKAKALSKQNRPDNKS